VVGINIPFELLLFDFFFKHYPDKMLLNGIRPFRKSWVGRPESIPYHEEHLKFGKHFKHLIDEVLFEDVPYNKIQLIAKMHKGHLQRMLWILYKMGLVIFLDDTRADKSQSEMEELVKKIRYNERGHLFDVLGIHWSSDDEEIEEAYAKNLTTLKNAKKDTTETKEHLLNDISKQVEKAYSQLKEWKERQKYRIKLFEEAYIVHYAELQQRKAESYLFSKEDPEQTIVEAANSLEVHPKNGEALALLGLAKFYHGYARDRFLQIEGRSILKKGHKMLPKSILTNLCMGMMYKKERQVKDAKIFYQKVLEIHPRNMFARVEIRELETGKKDKERDRIIGEFLGGRQKKNPNK